MTDDQRKARPAAQYGPTGATVARNVQDLRKARGLSIYQLSAALRAGGRAITPAAVGKIERQQRQVTVDDLVTLAAVLRVNPSRLMLPFEDSPAESVEVTGVGAVAADSAWDWMDGEMPIERVEPGDPSGSLMQFQLYARPPGRRMQLSPGEGD
ncbi:helix-turn-helix domain-containing protein [Streptomyces sp. NPDC127037]|uniref:helix-turn-helix domain-containing protein n=1 Tax=Streptomyces sp. NPDC127037 TaxID=3347113 RepID=UPI003652A797